MKRCRVIGSFKKAYISANFGRWVELEQPESRRADIQRQWEDVEMGGRRGPVNSERRNSGEKMRTERQREPSKSF